MTISEVVGQLLILLEEHGDIDVICVADGDRNPYHPILGKVITHGHINKILAGMRVMYGDEGIHQKLIMMLAG